MKWSDPGAKSRPVLGGSLNLERTIGLGSFNIPKSKNCQFLFFEKNRIKELAAPVHLKTLRNGRFS
jgi:hypothetical protein